MTYTIFEANLFLTFNVYPNMCFESIIFCAQTVLVQAEDQPFNGPLFIPWFETLSAKLQNSCSFDVPASNRLRTAELEFIKHLEQNQI